MFHSYMHLCILQKERNTTWTFDKMLTLFKMGFFGAAHRWGGQIGPPSLKSVTHILQWWNLEQLYLIWKGSEKYMDHVKHVLSSADISNFSTEISKFCYIKKYMYRLQFDAKFLILLTFLESLKIVLIKKVTILMMSAKMATPDLLKITVLWNKGYDVIIYVHDIPIKILSHDSNYTVDVVMWPKFGNSNIAITEVIIISNL